MGGRGSCTIFAKSFETSLRNIFQQLLNIFQAPNFQTVCVIETSPTILQVLWVSTCNLSHRESIHSFSWAGDQLHFWQDQSQDLQHDLRLKLEQKAAGGGFRAALWSPGVQLIFRGTCQICLKPGSEIEASFKKIHVIICYIIISYCRSYVYLVFMQRCFSDVEF